MLEPVASHIHQMKHWMFRQEMSPAHGHPASQLTAEPWCRHPALSLAPLHAVGALLSPHPLWVPGPLSQDRLTLGRSQSPRHREWRSHWHSRSPPLPGSCVVQEAVRLRPAGPGVHLVCPGWPMPLEQEATLWQGLNTKFRRYTLSHHTLNILPSLSL